MSDITCCQCCNGKVSTGGFVHQPHCPYVKSLYHKTPLEEETGYSGYDEALDQKEHKRQVFIEKASIEAMAALMLMDRGELVDSIANRALAYAEALANKVLS